MGSVRDGAVDTINHIKCYLSLVMIKRSDLVPSRTCVVVALTHTKAGSL